MPLSPDERQLVEAACHKAERLVRSLQTDADTLPTGSPGHQLHRSAIDAARRTLNNLQRLLNEAAETNAHGGGDHPT